MDLFASYPRVERASVEPIVRRLRAEGRSVFFDTDDIKPGIDFATEIDVSVKTAKAVLAFWSPAAFESPWCLREWRVGQTRGVLIPVAVSLFRDLQVPTEFNGLQVISLVGWNGDPAHAGWIALQRAISHHASPSPSDERSTQIWEKICGSLDWRDYADFLDLHPNAPSAFEARQHRRQLEDWSKADQSNPDAVAEFRKRPAFSALHTETGKQMRRASEAKVRAKEAEEAAMKALIESIEEATRKLTAGLPKPSGP